MAMKRMNISKTTVGFSVLIALLVLLASGAGWFLKSTYARETPSWVIQAMGQDIANVVSALTLLVAVSFAGKGSLKALLVWMGVLITLLYSSVIYAFAVHFNRLFLVYVAILGLSFYTLVGSVIRLPLDRLQSFFATTRRTRLVSVFLSLVGVLFFLLWLKEDIPALLAGTVPQSVIQSGLLTNPVHVLDLGLYLPAMLITAIFLWRGRLLGYLLALPLLVFVVLTGVGILAIDLVMAMKGMPVGLGVDTFITVIVLMSLVLSVFIGHGMQEQGGKVSVP
jgi:hypothetical protein